MMEGKGWRGGKDMEKEKVREEKRGRRGRGIRAFGRVGLSRFR